MANTMNIKDEDILSLITSCSGVNDKFLKELGEIIYPDIPFDSLTLKIFPEENEIAPSAKELAISSKDFPMKKLYALYPSEELLVAEPEEEYIPKKKEKAEKKPKSGSLEIPLKFKDKIIGTINLSSKQSIYTDKEKKCLESIAKPITLFIESENLAQKLKEAEESYEKIIKSSGIGIIFFDKDGKCRDCNDRAREILKNASKKCLIDEFIQTGKKDILGERFLNGLKKALNGVLNIVDSIKLDTGDQQEKKEKWITSTFLPVTDNKNKVNKVVGILEDITNEKVLEHKLQEAEKLAATGQLAAGIAHEINNPLSGIKNAFYILEKEFPKDHPKRVFFDIIDKELNRVSKIVLQLLDFYRVKEDVFEKLDIAKIIDELKFIISGKLKSASVELKTKIDDTAKIIISSANKIKQVFLAIMINAIESMPKEGELTIATRKGDNGIYIDFIDTGCGIPEEHIKDIFKPFYTTKTDRSKYASLGLGLSIAKATLDSVGGEISVISKVGEGSKFTIFLLNEL